MKHDFRCQHYYGFTFISPVCPADHYQPLLTAATACTACPINTHTVSAVNNAQIACVCDEGWRGPPGGPCERRSIHYSDVIMSAMASQITGVSIVCSAFFSCADLRKHQSFASLAFVRGIHRRPVVPNTNGQ